MIKDEDFVGSWRLLSFESRVPSGEVHRPFGDAPSGVITYSADHRMSAMLWRPDRSPFAIDDQQRGTLEEYAAAVRTVFQYVGTFELRPEDSAIVHRIEQSIFPNLNGIDQVRGFELSAGGNRLVLTTPPMDFGAEGLVSTLTWRRLGAS